MCLTTIMTRLFVAIMLLVSLKGVRSEIREVNVVLRPSSSAIHYSDGFIRGPGSIDLSELSFRAMSSESQGSLSNDDDGFRQLDGINNTHTAVDVVVFRLPDSCGGSDCDRTTVGVGGRCSGDYGAFRWCCSWGAIKYGLCEQEQFGRLIYNTSVFHGYHKFIKVPQQGQIEESIRSGKLDGLESGRYEVIFTNCNDEGRPVEVSGRAIWKSKNGYLPGNLFGAMYFYMCLTITYIGLIAWYAGLMRKSEENRIPIEESIVATILVGAVDSFIRTGDCLIWNLSGHRMTVGLYLGSISDVLRRGAIRFLVLKISLGWGVVHDTIRMATRVCLIVTIAVYLAVTAVHDLELVHSVEHVNTLSSAQESKLFASALILAAVNVVLFFWTAVVLFGTILNLDRSRELRQYLVFSGLLLVTLLISSTVNVFSLTHKFEKVPLGIFLISSTKSLFPLTQTGEKLAWIMDAVNLLSSFFVLIGVACLWRPNRNTRDYAHVAVETGENELELTEALPSTLVEDDEKLGTDIADYRDKHFQIDDAEAA